MKMILESMTLTNFKGVRQATYSFGSKLTEIDGANATGKTTIPDAFMWVLFGKDASGNAAGTDAFHEKPLDEAGNEIHNLETSVELVCRLDGDPFTLKRAQSENWVKKRGQSASVFQGNVSTYYINGVELKASEFKKRIAAICDEKVFVLIARLSALNALPWQERRGILMQLADLDVNAQLLKNEDYAPLADECTVRGVSIDDLRKVLQSSLRDITKELQIIPARIDEARRNAPEVTEAELSEAELAVKVLPEQIEALDAKIRMARTESAAAVRESTLISLKTELTALQNAAMAELTAKRSSLISRKNDADTRLRTLSSALEHAMRVRKDCVDQIASLTAQIDAERASYTQVYHKPFAPDSDYSVCPVCGQPTPDSYRDSMGAKAKAAFISSKKAELKRIETSGKELSTKLTAIKEQEASSMKDVDHLTKSVEAEKKNLEDIDQELSLLPAVPDYAQNPRYAQLTDEIARLKAQQPAEANDEADVSIRAREQLTAQLDRARAVLAQVSAAEKVRLRIEELKEQQRKSGDHAADLEVKVDLCSRFIADRCALLEQEIDSFFPTVRWKLFNTQINGGIADCCECLIPCGGTMVPYQGANTGSKLQADLEIVNVLSSHYDTWLPLFFDNKESVNALPPFDGQIITLSVSASPTLNIHIKEE